MESGLRHILGYQSRMQATGQLFSDQNVNPELEHKVTRVTEKFSENLHVIANEPSLAFFRVQEHVRKSLPQLVERKHEVQDLNQQVTGACFDTEYAINTVQNMQKSETHFKNIQDLLKNAMFLKQQIQYEQARREQERNKPSMYRGNTMVRTQTVDIPAGYVAEVEARRADFTGSVQIPTATRAEHQGSPRARSSSLSGQNTSTNPNNPFRKN